MTPQRRTALVSVGAACALIALKLSTGLASGSLGLVSEAVHSGTDLVAALLTFFAGGVAVRPADRSHPYGHGKAEAATPAARGAAGPGAYGWRRSEAAVFEFWAGERARWITKNRREE